MGETVSIIGAAQRLGISAEEVRDLVKQKRLKETEPGRITIKSIYDYSGLQPQGRQTEKRAAGRKPKVVDIKGAAAYLGVSVSDIKALVERGELEIVEGAKGVRGVRESMMKMYKKKMDDREERVMPKEEREDEKDADKKREESAAEDTQEAHQEEQTAEPMDVPEVPQGAEDTAADTESDETKDGFDLTEVMEELFPGIRRLPEFVAKAALATAGREEEEEAFSKREMRMVADMAFMRGRLSVYESMDEFKRRGR